MAESNVFRTDIHDVDTGKNLTFSAGRHLRDGVQELLFIRHIGARGFIDSLWTVRQGIQALTHHEIPGQGAPVLERGDSLIQPKFAVVYIDLFAFLKLSEGGQIIGNTDLSGVGILLK